MFLFSNPLLRAIAPKVMFSFADGAGEGEGAGAGEGEGAGAGAGAGEGAGVVDWRQGIDPELATHPALNKFKSSNDLFKSYLSLEQKLGKKSVALPDENATPEQKAEFYNALGRPENADGYGLKMPSDLPEGFEVKEDGVKGYQEFAHSIGLSKEHTEAVFDWYIGTNKEGYKQNVEKFAEDKNNAEVALRKEWGEAYDQNRENAKKVLGLIEDKNAQSYFLNIGNEPNVLKGLHELGKMLSEDAISGNFQSFVKTPEEATQEIKQIQTDSTNEWHAAYMTANHIRHKEAVEYVDNLSRMAYPEKKAGA